MDKTWEEPELRGFLTALLLVSAAFLGDQSEPHWHIAGYCTEFDEHGGP